MALQTPSIPGLSSYPGSLSTFGAQDFSMGPDMGLGPLSWSSHQIPTSLAHSRYVPYPYICMYEGAVRASHWTLSLVCFSGLPHLAVSSSTPPPSTSPLPVKIKSEPISPPREHHMANSGSAVPSSNIHLNTIGHSHQHLHGHTLNLTHAGHHNIPRPSSTGQLTPTPGE